MVDNSLKKPIEDIKYFNSEGKSIGNLVNEVKVTNKLFRTFLTSQLGVKFSTVLSDKISGSEIPDEKQNQKYLEDSDKLARKDRMWQYGEGAFGPIAPALRSSMQLITDITDTIKDVKEKVSSIPGGDSKGSKQSDYEKATLRREAKEKAEEKQRKVEHEGPPEKSDSMNDEILDELKNQSEKLDKIVEELEEDDKYQLKDVTKSYDERRKLNEMQAQKRVPMWGRGILNAAGKRSGGTGGGGTGGDDGFDIGDVLGGLVGSSLAVGGTAALSKILGSALRKLRPTASGAGDILGETSTPTRSEPPLLKKKARKRASTGDKAANVLSAEGGQKTVLDRLEEKNKPKPSPTTSAGATKKPKPRGKQKASDALDAAKDKIEASKKAPPAKAPKGSKGTKAPKPPTKLKQPSFKDLAKGQVLQSGIGLAKGIGGAVAGMGIHYGGNAAAEYLESKGHYKSSRFVGALTAGLSTTALLSPLAAFGPLGWLAAGAAGIGTGLYSYFSDKGERRGEGMPGTVTGERFPEGTLPPAIEEMPDGPQKDAAIKELEKVRERVINSTNLDRSQILGFNEFELDRITRQEDLKNEKEETLRGEKWSPRVKDAAAYNKELQRVAANPTAAKYLNYLIQSGRSPYGNAAIENLPTGHFSPKDLTGAVREMEAHPLEQIQKPERPEKPIKTSPSWAKSSLDDDLLPYKDVPPTFANISSVGKNVTDHPLKELASKAERLKEEAKRPEQASVLGSVLSDTPLPDIKVPEPKVSVKPVEVPEPKVSVNPVEVPEPKVSNLKPVEVPEPKVSVKPAEVKPKAIPSIFGSSVGRNAPQPSTRFESRGVSNKPAADLRDIQKSKSKPVVDLKALKAAQSKPKPVVDLSKLMKKDPSVQKPEKLSKTDWFSQGLGSISGKYESGGKAGRISSGKGDYGGKSYGIFQLASKTGSLDKFLKDSGYGNKFKGLKVGSKEFDEKWRELANNDSEFEKAQRSYIGKEYYTPAVAKLKEAGLDVSNRSQAVQEAVFSTAVQYGVGKEGSSRGAVGVFSAAFKDKDISKMSDQELIKTLYDYKKDSVGSRFAKSSAAVRAGVAKRFEREGKDLLAMANKVEPDQGLAMQKSLAVNEGEVENKKIHQDISLEIAKKTGDQMALNSLRPAPTPPVIVGQSSPAASTPIRAREPSPYDRYQDRMMAVVS